MPLPDWLMWKSRPVSINISLQRRKRQCSWFVVRGPLSLVSIFCAPLYTISRRRVLRRKHILTGSSESKDIRVSERCMTLGAGLRFFTRGAQHCAFYSYAGKLDLVAVLA